VSSIHRLGVLDEYKPSYPINTPLNELESNLSGPQFLWVW